MNLSKAWNTKLEVASFFLLSKILYKKCVEIVAGETFKFTKPSKGRGKIQEKNISPIAN